MARAWKEPVGSRLSCSGVFGLPVSGILSAVVLSRGRGASRGFLARESQRAGTAEVHSSAGRAGARAGRGPQVTPPGSWDVGAGGKARGSRQRGAEQFSPPTLLR